MGEFTVSNVKMQYMHSIYNSTFNLIVLNFSFYLLNHDLMISERKSIDRECNFYLQNYNSNHSNNSIV